jgi:nucleotide-binding universal stress UspA family protein
MADYSRRQSFPGYTHADEYKNEREKGEHLLETIVDELPDEVPVDTEITAGSPPRSIIGYDDDNDVSQIVIGNHGRETIARFLLGSVAEAVIRRSAVPVTVVRPNEKRA